MYKQILDRNNQVRTDVILRVSDNACIPFDTANTDYQAFLKYKEEGGKVYGADEEVPSGQASK
jgi:hypothetical protein